MKISGDMALKLALGAALVGVVGYALYRITKPGAAGNAGAALGTAFIDLSGGVATGVINGVSNSVGLPTTNETITDANECKIYMDANGKWAASTKCGAPAFVKALMM
jgi:hypothetical protein